MTEAAALSRATLMVRLLAVDPASTGLRLCGAPGPARARFLEALRGLVGETALRRCPCGIDDERLLGGLDLAATLASGRPVAQRGLLACCDGGVLVVAAAERLAAGTASHLAAALDTGEVTAERDGLLLREPARFGLVLLDEGIDESAPMMLLDRLAFSFDAETLPPAEDLPFDVAAAQARLAAVRVPEAVRTSLCATALAFGIGSLRAALLALRVTRGLAALDGRQEATLQDAGEAGALVLAHRATQVPVPEQLPADAQQDEAPAEAQPDTQPETKADADGSGEDDQDAASQVMEATRAALPAGLLAGLTGAAARSPGAAGRMAGRPRPASRGRRIGSMPGKPGQGRRLDLVASLRAAAPLQALRRRDALLPRDGVLVRADDLRVLRCEQRRRATAIFVVDASGSAAMHRMAEAKGAVETLLSECYVRRDRVALIAFRGDGAELLLPPTGALTRARRSLAGLPGGGGTPIAAGIDAAGALAIDLRRRGDNPLVVLLTDGRANVARSGARDRTAAQADAERSAAMLRGAGIASLLIDISPRPQPLAGRLAQAMGATFLALPSADPRAMSAAVRAAAA